MSITEKILSSWCCRNGNVNKTKDLITWVQKLNERTYVNIVEKSIYQDNFWFYDDYNGEILNRKRSFFSIKGMRRFDNENFISEQPVIIQPEIGYLGIICKEIDGMINFLMQAKIEPGNINCVQISPTIHPLPSSAPSKNTTPAPIQQLFPIFIPLCETPCSRMSFDKSL